MQLAIASFMLLMGVGIAGVWTRDILASPDVDLSDGFFRARDSSSGSLFWLHWAAEYGTALVLVAGGIGLFSRLSWGAPTALLGIGALLYTSVNSLGWTFAERERRAYAVPMLIGLAGGVPSAVWLILHG